MATTWNGELGDGGFVVYGRNSIRKQAEDVLADLAADGHDYNEVIEFESSNMYPFSPRSHGEYTIGSLLWDEDTQTVCIILDD